MKAQRKELEQRFLERVTRVRIKGEGGELAGNADAGATPDLNQRLGGEMGRAW